MSKKRANPAQSPPGPKPERQKPCLHLWSNLNRTVSACRIGQPRDPGGAYRDRTDDLKLAKLALSQLSYGPDLGWWAREDLNLRPHAYQACALTNLATDTQTPPPEK